VDADDVHAVLALLADAGIPAWVDGGWGVDALVGERTRPHSDVDLVVPAPDADRILAVLATAGYRRVLRDLRPAAVAVADGQGREVDFHLVTPTPDGGGDQAGPDGGCFHYPPPVTGSVGGRPVRCVDAATQVRAHLGYPPTAKDRADLRLLHERLGVDLPPPYGPPP
jgi:lincosamide nucleotidyltransferase A/C/D/E